MNKISKIIYGLLIALVVVWQLPWLYEFLTVKYERTPFTLYSSVIGDFAMTGFVGDTGLERQDLAGNVYTDKEFDAILPFFYVRQLMTDQRFPDTVAGRPVTPRDAQIGNFIFRSTPSDINTPSTGLYFLLESFSGRVELKMPKDVFRIHQRGIEFINMERNEVDAEKSFLFTEAMEKKGFVFPAKLINSNPTTRKEYDEGYLLTDANDKLYHLKMMAGRPFFRAIELPNDIQPMYVWVTEYANKKTLGFLVDTKEQLYVLTRDYGIYPVEAGPINPFKEAFTIFGNMIDWTVAVSCENAERYYAVDADTFTLIKQHIFRASNDSFGERYRNYLMPVRLQFTSGSDKFVYPRVNR